MDSIGIYLMLIRLDLLNHKPNDADIHEFRWTYIFSMEVQCESHLLSSYKMVGEVGRNPNFNSYWRSHMIILDASSIPYIGLMLMRKGLKLIFYDTRTRSWIHMDRDPAMRFSIAMQHWKNQALRNNWFQADQLNSVNVKYICIWELDKINPDDADLP